MWCLVVLVSVCVYIRDGKRQAEAVREGERERDRGVCETWVWIRAAKTRQSLHKQMSVSDNDKEMVRIESN